MAKYQVPTIGGIRKVIRPGAGAVTPGTTIAELGAGTISLATLAAILTQIQAQQAPSNTVGAQGTPGARGLPGMYWMPEDGAPGEDGPPGPAGAKGATGATGGAGGQGGIGPPGMDGEPGADGDMGPPGPAGATGGAGATGTPGQIMFAEDGADGDMGPPGPAGAAGSAGAPGSVGTAGARGAPGEDGQDGEDGRPGPAGSTGLAGSTGPAGAIGPPGYVMFPEDGNDGDQWPVGPAGAIPVAANPSASIGLAVSNGTATTFMRSDGAPALSQAIAPTWTGNHTFTPASGVGIAVNAVAGAHGLTIVTTSTSTPGAPLALSCGSGGAVMELSDGTNTASYQGFDSTHNLQFVSQGYGMTFYIGAAPSLALTIASTGAVTVAGSAKVTGNFACNGMAVNGADAGWGSPVAGVVIANFPGSTATLAQCGQALGRLLLICKNFGFIAA
jgi:hypothetical protein